MTNAPTLRRGDENADGWVEYLQTQLKTKDGLNLTSLLEVSGRFDELTHWCVVEFQAYEGLLSKNGVVGNETWARLLGQQDEDPGHDGMGAGHVDRGVHLRFQDFPSFDSEHDILTYHAFSVGTNEPAEGTVTLLLHLRDPQGHEYQAQQTNEAGQDRHYTFKFYDLTKDHPRGPFSGIAQLTYNGQVLDSGQFDFVDKGEQLIDI